MTKEQFRVEYRKARENRENVSLIHEIRQVMYNRGLIIPIISVLRYRISLGLRDHGEYASPKYKNYLIFGQGKPVQLPE